MTEQEPDQPIVRRALEELAKVPPLTHVRLPFAKELELLDLTNAMQHRYQGRLVVGASDTPGVAIVTWIDALSRPPVDEP
jgi:hypothetical protein